MFSGSNSSISNKSKPQIHHYRIKDKTEVENKYKFGRKIGEYDKILLYITLIHYNKKYIYNINIIYYIDIIFVNLFKYIYIYLFVKFCFRYILFVFI